MNAMTSSKECTEMQGISYLMRKYDNLTGGDRPYALVHLNIKNFRYFNTKYSAAAGDEILQLVFESLTGWLEPQEYVGHLYADNFGFLVRCDDIDQLVYERLMLLIDRVYRIQDERIYRNLCVSMGIYQMTDRAVPFHDALCCANLCRKETDSLFKRCGSMEICDEHFVRRYMDRMELEVRTADAYKNYEFVNYLQPKVDIKTGRVVGAEALLRWFNEDGTSIPLCSFLPILDENGYISLIDIDTFEQLCRHLEDRIKKNQKVVPISFNVSKSHFNDPDMVQDYISVFEKYDIPKHLVEIELTESIAFNDANRIKEVVSAFKDYGFTCALDDFGNGYSSFGVLLNAPLDIVKMDRQFFLSNQNGDSERVIRTVVDLIHSLNMKVVAEGVESQTHIDWLKNCGCDYVQGFYYYKPMPIDQFDALLDNE